MRNPTWSADGPVGCLTKITWLSSRLLAREAGLLSTSEPDPLTLVNDSKNRGGADARCGRLRDHPGAHGATATRADRAAQAPRQDKLARGSRRIKQSGSREDAGVTKTSLKPSEATHDAAAPRLASGESLFSAAGARSCHSDPTSRWTETRLDLAATCLRLARCSTSARAARWPCSNGLYGVLTAAQRDRSRSFMRVDLHICAPVAMNRFARVSGMSFVSGLRLGPAQQRDRFDQVLAVA